MAADMQAGKMPNFGPRVDGLCARSTPTWRWKELIAVAYDVKPYQVSGPAWLATERVRHVATMRRARRRRTRRQCCVRCWKKRFKLTAHKDTQEHPVFALVVAKGGSKMKESPAPQPLDPDAPLKPGEMRMNTANGPAIVKQSPDGSATVNMGE